jgi:hypothetical protein
MTKSPTLANARRRRALLLFGVVLCGGVTTESAAHAQKSRAIDTAFRAAYPSSAPVTTQLAGVALGRFAIAGLQQYARSEHAPEEGGIALSFADSSGQVRVLVRVAVCADSAAARRVLDAELHGVSSQLARVSDTPLGDAAWADAAGKGTSLVLATQGNIAYAVDVTSPAPGIATAATIAAALRATMAPGVPVFPAVSVRFAATLDAKRGGEVLVEVPGGHPYKLRADGAYVARGASGPLVRPFHAGAITVYATVVDDLARVTVASATTIAR